MLDFIDVKTGVKSPKQWKKGEFLVVFSGYTQITYFRYKNQA